MFNTRIVAVARAYFVENFHVNKFIVLEIFHAFNFRGAGYPRKLFNLKHFPIYGSRPSNKGIDKLQCPNMDITNLSNVEAICPVTLYKLIIICMGRLEKCQYAIVNNLSFASFSRFYYVQSNLKRKRSSGG